MRNGRSVVLMSVAADGVPVERYARRDFPETLTRSLAGQCCIKPVGHVDLAGRAGVFCELRRDIYRITGDPAPPVNAVEVQNRTLIQSSYDVKSVITQFLKQHSHVIESVLRVVESQDGESATRRCNLTRAGRSVSDQCIHTGIRDEVVEQVAQAALFRLLAMPCQEDHHCLAEPVSVELFPDFGSANGVAQQWKQTVEVFRERVRIASLPFGEVFHAAR